MGGTRSTTRRVVAAVLLAAGLATSVFLPAPASADDVQDAQARVARLQTLVASTTRQLTDGTRAWERDQSSLRRVEAQLGMLRLRVAAQQKVVDRTRAHVNLVARSLFMQPLPLPDQLSLVLADSPESALATVQAQDAVDHVAGGDDRVILTARRARLTLRQEQQQVEHLTRTARRLTERSAQRMAALQALASSTARQLDLAERVLADARAARAAREARARAAAAAAARAAAARAHGAVRFAPQVWVGAGACGTTAGQQNGMLDPSTLAPLWGAPGMRLRCDAAAAFNRMSQYHQATTGSPLCVADSYRSFSEQVDVYRRKPELAAVPGTSNHGWGLAVDLCGGVQVFGSAAHRWMQANAGRFGWFHPAWAEPSGSKPEAWHWEFRG